MPALLLSKEKAPRGLGAEMLQLAPTAGLRSTAVAWSARIRLPEAAESEHGRISKIRARHTTRIDERNTARPAAGARAAAREQEVFLPKSLTFE